MEPTPKKLLDQVRDAIRLKHYSIRTEQAYVTWIKRYIYFHSVRHPAEMGTAEIQAFLTHLAVEGNVAASTQNQALSALLFLSQLCHPPPGSPLRHSHRPGTPRPQGRKDHHDLHSRPQPGRPGRAQPAGLDGSPFNFPALTFGPPRLSVSLR